MRHQVLPRWDQAICWLAQPGFSLPREDFSCQHLHLFPSVKRSAAAPSAARRSRPSHRPSAYPAVPSANSYTSGVNKPTRNSPPPTPLATGHAARQINSFTIRRSPSASSTRPGAPVSFAFTWPGNPSRHRCPPSGRCSAGSTRRVWVPPRRAAARPAIRHGRVGPTQSGRSMPKNSFAWAPASA